MVSMVSRDQFDEKINYLQKVLQKNYNNDFLNELYDRIKSKHPLAFYNTVNEIICSGKRNFNIRSFVHLMDNINYDQNRYNNTYCGEHLCYHGAVTVIDDKGYEYVIACNNSNCNGKYKSIYKDYKGNLEYKYPKHQDTTIEVNTDISLEDLNNLILSSSSLK